MDALIFLGDGLRDLELALTLCPKLRAYSVAGNCDYGALEPTDGLAAFDGVVIFYTHGHMYGVKYDLDTLADAASARGAEVALFGHTHIPHAETLQQGVPVQPRLLRPVLHRARTPTAS
ncbi:MAG: metallophosphoesterase family protein [Faecalibacterium prausnitzii]